LVGIGWLEPGAVERWRQGRVGDLEGEVQTSPARVAEAMALQQYRTYWMAGDLSAKEQKRLTVKEIIAGAAEKVEASVARMRVATSGACRSNRNPACRCAHAGYLLCHCTPSPAPACLPVRYLKFSQPEEELTCSGNSGHWGLIVVNLQTFGIDISSYSLNIDWKRVTESLNPRFVFVRASYMKERAKANPGDPSVADPNSDSLFTEYWKALAPLKIARGAYVFCHPWGDPDVTTRQFFSDYTPQAGDLLPTIDIEDVWDSSCGVPQTTRIALIKSLVDNVAKRVGGQKPIIYTKTRVWTDLGNPKQFSDCPLWILNYQALPSGQNMPSAWQKLTFWQYAENLKVDGVGGDYDPDLFNGAETDLKSYCIQKVTV